jgi:hypothetical protein
MEEEEQIDFKDSEESGPGCLYQGKAQQLACLSIIRKFNSSMLFVNRQPSVVRITTLHRCV